MRQLPDNSRLTVQRISKREAGWEDRDDLTNRRIRDTI